MKIRLTGARNEQPKIPLFSSDRVKQKPKLPDKNAVTHCVYMPFKAHYIICQHSLSKHERFYSSAIFPMAMERTGAGVEIAVA